MANQPQVYKCLYKWGCFKISPSEKVVWFMVSTQIFMEKNLNSSHSNFQMSIFIHHFNQTVFWELERVCHNFQISSVAQLYPTLCDLMDCSMPGLPVYRQLLESTQTHVHRVSDAIQPSHPLSSLSPPAFNLSQHQGLFQWVSSSHQVDKVLEFQLQHQSFQWIFRTDFL